MTNAETLSGGFDSKRSTVISSMTASLYASRSPVCFIVITAVSVPIGTLCVLPPTTLSRGCPLCAQSAAAAAKKEEEPTTDMALVVAVVIVFDDVDDFFFFVILLGADVSARPFPVFAAPIVAAGTVVATLVTSAVLFFFSVAFSKNFFG